MDGIYTPYVSYGIAEVINDWEETVIFTTMVPTSSVTIDLDGLSLVNGLTLVNGVLQIPSNYQGQIIIVQVVSPENATNPNVTWTSSDPGVVTVGTSVPNQNGIINIVGIGTATITVETVQGDHVGSIDIEVVSG